MPFHPNIVLLSKLYRAAPSKSLPSNIECRTFIPTQNTMYATMYAYWCKCIMRDISNPCGLHWKSSINRGRDEQAHDQNIAALCILRFKLVHQNFQTTVNSSSILQPLNWTHIMSRAQQQLCKNSGALLIVLCCMDFHI